MKNSKARQLLESGPNSALEITNDMLRKLNEQMSSIHNWSSFCETKMINYRTLVNVRMKRLKYLSPEIIRIFDLFEVNVDPMLNIEDNE